MNNFAGSGAEKRCLLCECTAAKKINDDLACLEFFWTGPIPRAGQFFLVKPSRTSGFLARPFSVFSYKAADAVGKPGTISFLILIQGRGSSELIEFRVGETAELIGPLGNSWASVFSDESPVALVSGGVGIAPLAFFAEELSKEKKIQFDFYAGFRSQSFGLPQITSARSIIIASEDGSEGSKGRILDFFDPSQYKAVYICGPEAMLIAAAKKCEGTPCFISMEKHMACGTGACLGCTIKTKNGNKRCCSDGPIFNAEEICFE